MNLGYSGKRHWLEMMSLLQLISFLLFLPFFGGEEDGGL